MPYEKQLSSATPGLIIICLDQSGSMADSYTTGYSKADYAALAVNRVIHEIINSCVAGDVVKPRVEIGVIVYNGYGAYILKYGNDLELLGNVSKLAEHMDTMSLLHVVPDGIGGMIEQETIMRAFVRPFAGGGTPMAQAFELARQKIDFFTSICPDGFPPVVINITDGAPDDAQKAFDAARRLVTTGSHDGRTLLLNAHVDSASEGQIILPRNITAFANNDFARYLFDISSPLPAKLANSAIAMGFKDITPEITRGFVFNADADTLVRFLNFGSDLAR